MNRGYGSIGRWALVALCFGAVAAGCRKNDDGAPVTSATPAQTAQAVQNNQSLPPGLRSQFTTPSGRPAGAPAAPKAP